MNEQTISIPARLKNVTGGHVAGAEDIIDDTLGKEQSDINQERINDIEQLREDTQEDIQRIEDKVDEIGDAIQFDEDGDLVTVDGSDFSDPDASAKIPTIGAIKAGADTLGIVYDVSAKNPSAGPNHDGKFESLAALLADINLSTLIPTSVRRGGMSIKFVQSSDNKYVQFMLNAQDWTVDVNYWEKVNLEKEFRLINEQINKINITSDAAGVTPYIFKAGVTYHIKNNGASITISHRNTPDGSSEDFANINPSEEIDYIPTTDGLYLRYGTACDLDIYIIDGLYDAAQKTNKNSDELRNVLLHSSLASYAIQAEGFEDGRYWYDDNGQLAVLLDSNVVAGVAEKIPVSEGDDIRFNVSGSFYLLIVTDTEGNVIESFRDYSSIAYLQGRYTIPANGAYLYINTAKNKKDESYCFVNTKLIPEVEYRCDNIEDCLMIHYEPTVQENAYYDSNGTLQTRTGLLAFEVNVENVRKIKCLVSESSYAYYGFVVNGSFVAQRWINSEHGGDNYGYICQYVPEGATKFLCSWNAAIISENDVSLMKNIDESVGHLTNAMNVTYDIKKDWVVGRFNMITGNLDTSNVSFKAVEISFDNLFAKTVTFKKTYTGDSTYACYGFVINGTWKGYQGVYPSSVEPYETTVEVPVGATKFKCCWNKNQATDDELVVKVVGYDFNIEQKQNIPVYQFEPDFNLSRVPQMTCPEGAVLEQMTLTELYAKYDALVTAYPDYITKVNCDTEVQTALEITAPSYMEGLPIYMYKFIPKMGSDEHGVEFVRKPKLLITSMHPQERLGVLATFEMMKMICENWTNDVNAEQLRSLVDIYVIPVPWPWNFANRSRANYNGINANRQFPTKHWEESGQGTHNWSGTQPLSEYEAKVVNYYLLQIKPSVCLDVHTSGNDDEGHMGIINMNKYDQELIDLCSVITRTTSNRAIQDNHNFPQNPNICIYGIYPEDDEKLGYFYEYAYEKGCKYSILSEESAYSKWDNGVFGGVSGPIIEQFTDGILREQVQYLYNIILRLTRQSCIQYYIEN